MGYSVKELIYTLQGEGAHAGRPAVFCRFTGCNLWTGRERDRRSAVCRFCDTDFLGVDGPGGGRFASAGELADAAARAWHGDTARAWLVCTGGEPALQLDGSLLDAFHARGFDVAIETNGTRRVPAALDWVCVSPKAGAPLTQRAGDELKVVFPQDGLDLEALVRLPFRHHFLQPMDGPALAENTRRAVEHCLTDPRWRLSLQTHKLIGIP